MEPNSFQEKDICILNFYEYLNIDDKNMKSLFKMCGKFLESWSEKFNIENHILTKIVTFFPSLYFDERYHPILNLSTNFILELENDKFKYTSLFYHEKLKLSVGLDFYSRHGNLNMVKYMCKLGFNVNIHNGKPIRFASERGHYAVVKCLYRHGAKIKIDGDKPAMLALSSKHFKIVKFFYKKGSFCTLEDYLSSEPPRFYKIEDNTINYLNAIIYLDKSGCDVNWRIPNLMITAVKENLLFFIEYFHNYANSELLNTAIKFSRTDIVEFLKSKGFVVDSIDSDSDFDYNYFNIFD